MSTLFIDQGRFRRRLIALLVVMVILATTWVPCVMADDVFAAMAIERPKTRLPAPAFSAGQLDETVLSLGDYAGKLVLLNFWATWCLPCREEMPGMQRLWQQYRERGFTVIAVAADDDREEVARFVANTSLDFPVVMDGDGRIRRQYEVVGLPMSYLIGRDGRLSGRLLGSRDWHSKEALALIESLLAEGNSGRLDVFSLSCVWAVFAVFSVVSGDACPAPGPWPRCSGRGR